MYVIGTAGHVDHGKSTLIEALTGIDPDRLKQEKARGMTIELGFAWVTLPGGNEVSIVDVPGHERFIKNMLMGATGIDLALLIIAADEGVMPQTREHIDILDILNVQRAVIVVTKRDLVDDEWLGLVRADIRETVARTTLEKAPIVPVSATTDNGLEDLIRAIETNLEGLPQRVDLGRPRLAVDRSFTMAGFGTVVTGTLVDGTLRVGQELVILPMNKTARIRGLQSHLTPVKEAKPGNRIAVNLSGVEHSDINRGFVVTTPDWLTPTDSIDGTLRILENAPRQIKHNSRLILYSGASEIPCRARLLNDDYLSPGQSGWVQIRLDTPIAVVKGDRFVVRDTTNTLGGGVVVECHARRHRRFHEPTVQRIEALAAGSNMEVFLSTLGILEPAQVTDVARSANISKTEAAQIAIDLAKERRLITLQGQEGYMFSAEGWMTLTTRVEQELLQYHHKFPLRDAMPSQELRSRLRLPVPPFAQTVALLAEQEILKTKESRVHLPDHNVTLTPDQERVANQYMDLLAHPPYSPPTDSPLVPDLLQVLIDREDVVKATHDVVFLKSAFEDMASKVQVLATQRKSIRIQDVREMLGTSRKYTLALLEHLDRLHVTRRMGDERILR